MIYVYNSMIYVYNLIYNVTIKFSDWGHQKNSQKN